MKVYRVKEDIVLMNGTFIKSGTICIRSESSFRISFSPAEIKTPGMPAALPIYDVDPTFILDQLEDVTADIDSYMKAIEIADEYRGIIGNNG